MWYIKISTLNRVDLVWTFRHPAMHHNSAGKKNWIFCNIHDFASQSRITGQRETNQAVDNSRGKCFTKIWSYFHLSYFTNHFPGDTLTARHAQHTSLPGQYRNMLTSDYYPIPLNSQCYPVRSISDQDEEFYPIPLNSQCYPLLSSTIQYFHIISITAHFWPIRLSSPFFLKSNQRMYCSDKCFLFIRKPAKWKAAGPPVQAPSLKVPLILSGSHR